MRHDSPAYSFAFAAGVCAVCALLVAAASVLLAERQRLAQTQYVQMTVLLEVGGLDPTEPGVSRRDLFRSRMRARLVDLRTGEYVEDPPVDPLEYDQRRARGDPAASHEAPPNDAQVRRIPHLATVFLVLEDERPARVVLPIEGKGLYSMMYGFIALERDTRTVGGLAFYEQAETPGLGGELANPRWRAQWRGRKALDEKGEVRIELVKGRAGPPAQDPYRVDGLAGATVTSRAVTDTLAFWLGEHGFGPYLSRARARGEL